MELVGARPLHLLSQTVLSLKSPTGAFIAPLRCANANLSGRGPSICYRRPFCHSNTPLGCLLLRKREGVRRTRLSSILCVRLRPSAGWLQESPCRRFLLPPAFRFAGAGVLPGPGLARSSPGIPCRRSCGFRGATGKTATKKPSQNRPAIPSPFWKVMLVGYVTAESQNVQPRRA